MSTIDTFTYTNGAQVRTVVIDGEPWFVLADLCKVLGLARGASQIAERLEDDVRQTYPISDALGRVQNTTIVNEPGMYEVVLRSDKPEAKQFRRWVTHEVIPTIRRTGSFGAQKALTEEEIVAQALAITSAKVKQLEAKVEQDAPKVDYFEQCVAPTDDIVTVRVAASHVGIPENLFRESMIAAGWIYRLKIGTRWSATEQRLKDEFEYRAKAAHADKFSLRAQHNAPRHHNGQVRQTLYIVAASLPAFVRRFGKETADAIAA